MGCGVSSSCRAGGTSAMSASKHLAAVTWCILFWPLVLHGAAESRHNLGIPSQPRGGIRSWPLAAHFCPRSLAAIFAGVGETRSAARRRQTGGGACVRVQAPTSAGGWDYLRICCPQVKFMSCVATLGCSERGSRQPHAGSRIYFRSFGHVQHAQLEYAHH